MPSKKQTSKHQSTAGRDPRIAAVTGFARNNFWGQLLLLLALAFLVLMSFFLNSVLGSFNYLEIFPNQLIEVGTMHFVAALIVALVFVRMKWLPTLLAKMLGTVIFSLLLVGYDDKLQAASGVIRAFVPGLTAQDPMWVQSIIYLLLLVAIATAAGALFQKWFNRQGKLKNRDIELGVIVLVAYIFVIPAFSVGKILPDIINESKTQASEFEKPTSQPDSSKPDIYYIVLDRYTSNSVLKSQFSYDNSQFTNYLRGKDYVVNDSAKSNYPYTTISVSSTLTSSYTNKLVEPFKSKDVQSRALYHNLIWQSPAVKAMKQAGYQYHNIGSTYGASYKAPLADQDHMWQNNLKVLNKNYRLRGITAVAFMQSPFYRLAQSGINWLPVQFQTKSDVDYLGEQLSTLDQLSTSGKSGGRFIFAHLLIPHEPFYFNADGSLAANPQPNSSDKPVKQKYLDQISYINGQMKKIVDQINTSSEGKAVVVINADEGPYPQVINSTARDPNPSESPTGDAVESSDMRNWDDKWLQMKFGILQAIHIPAATPSDLSHLSSVNIFRIVLNRYFGYNLDYLPICHYGLNVGSRYEYKYVDITGRLGDSADPACAAMQTSR